MSDCPAHALARPAADRARRWLRLLAAPLLLGLVLAAVEPAAALAALRGAGPGWLLAALLLVQAQIVVSALRWRFTAARLGQRMARRRAVSEYYLATLLNQTTPGGVGGDAARAWRTRATAGRLNTAVRAVVLERLGGQVAFFAVAATGLAAWPLLGRGSAPRDAAVLLAAGAGVLLLGALLTALVARRGPPAARRALHGLWPDLRRAWFVRSAWLVQGILSTAVVATYIGVFALCARALGDPLPPAALATAVPLVLLAMLLPVSVGGWGVREATAAALWPLFGLPAAHGVAASVLYGLVNLAGALPGLLRVLRRP
ncbi:lysylphosphatidylglycerol synthase transmembrane domain-containing protein [Coralloluteibacterium thermophilus]|uniref:YbhN family protein n=1 Tax=Coralloluteibacterium thermophilum TaxID=2707049 RepID=A0ABV9NJT8_9GAMM